MTERVAADIVNWQNQPLESVCLAVRLTVTGKKEESGMWLGKNESVAFWLGYSRM